MSSTSLPCTGPAGRQEPRIKLAQSGAGDRARDVIDLAFIADMPFDPWQETAAKIMFAWDRRAQRWACPEAAVVATRQNGKSAIIEARMLAGIYLWGEQRIVYTSHDFRAVTEIFDRLVARIDDHPSFKRAVARPYQGNNNRSILMKDGRKIQFFSRTGKAGRSMGGDTVILDEALYLQPDQAAAILATMTARSAQHPTQTVYASSAGLVISRVLDSVRGRALAGEARLGYAEWSVPGWHELDDDERAHWGTMEDYYGSPDTHAAANPALGRRISPEFLAQMWATFRKTSPRDFAREFLGVWDRVSGKTAVFEADEWERLAVDGLKAPEPVTVAVDVPPDRTSAVIAAAWPTPGGGVHGVVLDRREGVSWVPQALVDMSRRRALGRVYLNASGPAGMILQPIQAAGIRVTLVSLAWYAAACGDFATRVKTRLITHASQPELAEAVCNLAERPLRDGEIYTWTKADPLADISPAVAVTLACHGAAGQQIQTGGRLVIA
ncbi:MAG: hypothetical protein LBK42_13815 [Propionibacteriaceae bacterium]|jgi:phage terminase large subunit-like protein|nr:hypothetical protein [Propionibacteriaceae bacterium]